MKLLFRTSLMISSMIGVGVIASENASATTAPANQLKTIISTANAQSSVRISSTSTLQSIKVELVGHAGVKSGSQTITFATNGKTYTAQILLVANTAYVKGDAIGLEAALNLKSIEAEKIAGKWLKISNTNSSFGTVASGLTISSAMSEINMTGPTKMLSDQKLNGISVTAIAGKTASGAAGPSLAETLYGSTNGKPLPIEAIQTLSGHKATIKFSDWNSAIHLTAPTSTLKFSSSWVNGSTITT